MKNFNLTYFCYFFLYCLSIIGTLSCATIKTPGSLLSSYDFTFPKDEFGNTVVVDNIRVGMVDANAKHVVPFGKYVFIKPLVHDETCGSHALYKTETRNSVGLCNAKSNVVLKNKYKQIIGCYDGLIYALNNDEKEGVIDVKGNVIIPEAYQWIEIAKDNLFRVQKSDKYGVVNWKNEVVIPLKYDYVVVGDRDSIYAFTALADSIEWDVESTYRIDAYFQGKLTEDVNIPLSSLNLSSKISNAWKPSISGEGTYDFTIEMARFPGCSTSENQTREDLKMCTERKMLEFIYGRIEYPVLGRIHGIEGIAVVSFTVEKDGSINESKIIRDVKTGGGDAALRIVREMPDWIPGTKDGNPIRVQFNLPVNFKLEG